MWLFQVLIKRRLQKREVFTEGRLSSVLQLIKYLVYLMAFALALESQGVDIKILLVSSAALLVGLGMGLQEIFKDFISGIIILFEGNIKVGDVVEIDDLVGTIKEINIRTCEVETRDSTYVIVPNSKFVNDQIINWSHNYKKTRFSVSVGVAYGSDVDKVRELLLQCAAENPQVMDNPKPLVTFENFGDSSLDFKLFFWSREIWQAELLRSDLRFMISKSFTENNMQIPFPQMDVHVKREEINNLQKG